MHWKQTSVSSHPPLTPQARILQVKHPLLYFSNCKQTRFRAPKPQHLSKHLLDLEGIFGAVLHPQDPHTEKHGSDTVCNNTPHR